MGLFDWLKRDELRRIKYLEKELGKKKKEAFDLWSSNNQKDSRMFSIVAHMDVSMQGGRDWATVYNETVADFSEDEQVGLRQATLELMHRFQLEGKNLNMIQEPVFEFPPYAHDGCSNEVLGLPPSMDNEHWWKEGLGK